MNFPTAVKTCFRKYITFSGRASRSEYWWYVLFTIIAAMIFGAAAYLTESDSRFFTFITGAVELFSWAILLPQTAVAVRRLHDINWRGTIVYIMVVSYLLLEGMDYMWPMPTNEQLKAAGSEGAGMLLVQLLVYVPLSVLALVCWILSVILAAFKGTPGPNRFGSDPLAA